jgi:iron complex transport system ATP-binding protein
VQTDLQALRHRLITELSCGEQRRVILAQALAQQPQVLLLDEPTVHLDLRYQTELLALIRRLAQHDGIAVVVTLHDLNHAALCATHVALLAHGTLVAMGHPEAVLTPDCLSQVYGVTVVAAISGDLLSAVISIRCILGFRKDNPNVFNMLVQCICC